MNISRVTLHRVLPWVVSGASSLYIMRRARHLSAAEPQDQTVVRFLIEQSDLLVSLASTPTTWYIIHRARVRASTQQPDRDPAYQRFDDLRHMLTVLVIGLEVLRRKAIAGDLPSMLRTIGIMGKALADARQSLEELEHLYYSETTIVMTPRGTLGNLPQQRPPQE